MAEAVAALLRDDGHALRDLRVEPSTGVTLTLRHATLQLVETEAWLVTMEIVPAAAEGRLALESVVAGSMRGRGG